MSSDIGDNSIKYFIICIVQEIQEVILYDLNHRISSEILLD